MGCVFRVGGLNLDVDACLIECHFEPYNVFRKGEVEFKRTHQKSGFKIKVSEKDLNDLAGQIEDAISFLKSNADELKKLQEFPKVEWCVLDFPIEERDVFVQSDTLPSNLLKLVGNLDIDIEITRYPISAPSEDTSP